MCSQGANLNVILGELVLRGNDMLLICVMFFLFYYDFFFVEIQSLVLDPILEYTP